MKIVSGDVLNHKVTRPTLLLHVVNNCGVMGAGVAFSIANKYPVVKKSYLHWFEATESPTLMTDGESISSYIEDEWSSFQLGQIQAVKVAENLYVLNMLAQVEPGGTYIQIGEDRVYLRPIRMDSLKECLLRSTSLAKELKAEIIAPKFGCGLAGGSWNEIQTYIKEYISDYGIDVTIYEL